eukprot:1160166-Pelagomonas_calceolata.AAC.3
MANLQALHAIRFVSNTSLRLRDFHAHLQLTLPCSAEHHVGSRACEWQGQQRWHFCKSHAQEAGGEVRGQDRGPGLVSGECSPSIAASS